MNPDLLIRTMHLTQINMNCAGIAIFSNIFAMRLSLFYRQILAWKIIELRSRTNAREA
jgi:hypothetical protein